MTTAPPNPNALLPTSVAPMFREIAQGGYFTLNGVKTPGSKLLYPIWKGKKPVDNGDAENDTADTVYFAQSVVVVANMTENTISKIDFHSDGGDMLLIPQDGDGTLEQIGPSTSGSAGDYFAAGAWYQDAASIFFGSGGALSFKTDDPGNPATFCLGFGVSVRGGQGLGVTADLSDYIDLADFYGKTAGASHSDPCTSKTATGKTIKLTCCCFGAPVPEHKFCGVFLLLIEPV